MILLALTLSLAGSGIGYLGHPNQGLLQRALPAMTRGVAGLLLLLALLAWFDSLGGSAGPFAWLSSNMLAFVSMPYLGWLRRRRQVAPARTNTRR